MKLIIDFIYFKCFNLLVLLNLIHYTNKLMKFKKKFTVNFFFFDRFNLLKLAIKLFVDVIVEKLLKELLKNFKLRLIFKMKILLLFNLNFSIFIIFHFL